MARGRLSALREAGVLTGIWWYAGHPTQYQGDARLADAAAGERLLAATAEHVAGAARAINTDTIAKRMQDDFYGGSAAPSSTAP